MGNKIPAIKSTIGDWTYYTTSLSFKQVVLLVDKMSDELYQSKSLKKALQRSITDNYKNIEQYIISQPERFFNFLVLAIYDGEPNWIQVDLELGNDTFYNMGFLTLSGNEHIFPVDGQHRVEGIKSALSTQEYKELLKDERVPVVFIGHKNTDVGMQRSRRLFNTLNRYAKPVSQSDIIILDEDDTSAIATRFLIEDSAEVSLFKNSRLDDSLQKAINSANKTSFTSLIAFAECNGAIQKYYFKHKFLNTDKYHNYKNKYYSNKDKINYNDFKRYRPDKEVLDEFIQYTEDYWKKFERGLPFIQDYLKIQEENPAYQYRNSTEGGNILFRPIGIVPFVEATLKIMEKNENNSFDSVFTKFIENVEFIISKKPWINVVWSSQDHTMITVPKVFIRNLFLYVYDKSLLTAKQLFSLKVQYAKFIVYEGQLENISLENLIFGG